MARRTLSQQLAEHREIILQLTQKRWGACQDVNCPNCGHPEMSLLLDRDGDAVSGSEVAEPPIRLCRKCGHVQRDRPAR